MAARNKARKRALDVLFEAEARGADPEDILRRREADIAAPMNPYTRVLVEGVLEHHNEIDQLIIDFARDWDLDRMPAVDRNVLRIGIFELMWSPEIPKGVAISEAVSIVTELSTDNSPAFVNGVLAAIAER